MVVNKLFINKRLAIKGKAFIQATAEIIAIIMEFDFDSSLAVALRQEKLTALIIANNSLSFVFNFEVFNQ